jgi:hypothetical protein
MRPRASRIAGSREPEWWVRNRFARAIVGFWGIFELRWTGFGSGRCKHYLPEDVTAVSNKYGSVLSIRGGLP